MQEETTPTVVFLEYGEHDLVFRLSGYESAKRTIDIGSPTRVIRETLTKLPQGKLIIKVVPYADIFINGELVKSQKSRYETNLDPGRYTVVLHHPSKDSTIVVEIRPGEKVERTINLKERSESQ